MAIAIVIFLKNAWVTEDAYIMFRSIEQLFAGNGPVWNPHERVQVFTCPLWYTTVSFVRMISKNLYLNVIIVSFFLWLLTIFVIRKIFRNDNKLLISVLLFSASTAFFDYTSSGLENSLAYFIISVYILNFSTLFSYRHSHNDNSVTSMGLEKRIQLALFLFGLIICVRHDLSLILFPPTLYVIAINKRIFSIYRWIVITTIAFLPFILFSLFSLLYYGFPFPNTAYAKLNTGIDRLDLLKQGFNYFYISLKLDTITIFVIFGALIVTFFKSSQKKFEIFRFWRPT